MLNPLLFLAAVAADPAAPGAPAATEGALAKIGAQLGEFGVNVPHFASQLVAFLIVAALLRAFAYKPILDILDERKKKIEEGLANAEKSKTELANAEASRLAILKEANDKANAIIADAQKAAAAQTEKRTQEAVVLAEGIVAKGHESIKLERAKMIEDVKKEISKLIVTTTEKSIGRVLTPEDQKRLNQSSIDGLSA
ncbi:MAG: F0F1 ATP synthase subunit B [Candidatus Methylacidiphilales bacterium]|nr:F0F1 ATP synthase subunit B [Candidatus Methylacidiphilales bacterium]